MTTAIKTPTWFKVSRVEAADGQCDEHWTVRFRTIRNLTSVKKSGWGGDFDSKADAINAGMMRGWMYVDKWNEAVEAAAPLIAERRELWARKQTARAGRMHVRIKLADGSHQSRWVKPELAGHLLDFLSADEFGVVHETRGDILPF